MIAEVKLSYDSLKLNLDPKIFTLFIVKQNRLRGDETKKSTYNNFGSPIIKKSNKRDDQTNTDVALSLQKKGIDIIKAPLQNEFDSLDRKLLKLLLTYLTESLNIQVKTSFETKQRLANTIVAIIINYVALGEFGINKANRFYGLRTGQLIESLRGKMSD